MQSYRNYPYGGQPSYQYPAFVGGAPPNPYPSHNYPPHQNPYIPQDNREAPFIPPPPDASTPYQKSNRRLTAAPTALPLKPALKKTSYLNAHNDGLNRQATYPLTNPNTSQRLRMFTNPFRSHTSEQNHEEFRPLHMFMVLIGSNELRLENIMDPAMRELRATILPMWPDGVESDSQHGHDWTVKFRNHPWTLDGPNAPIAWEIIIQLFTLFARRGFAFQTSVNIGSPSPRLVFEVASEDRTSQFFLAFFSQGGRRLTLIKPPTVVDDTLGSQLKAFFRRNITEESVGDDARIIELKKLGSGASEVPHQFFLMHVLKVLAELGFNLVTSVPLGRRRPLGLRAGKEILIFRGANPEFGQPGGRE